MIESGRADECRKVDGSRTIGSNEELIAEARGSFKATNASASLIRRLADALEASDARYESAEHDRLYWRRLFRTMRKRAERAEAERDAALAAIERVRAIHRRYTYYELEDSCSDTSDEHREEHHRESDEIGEFYCELMPTGDVVCDLCRDADGERMDWPCPTVAALDGAPEPDNDDPCDAQVHSWGHYRPEQIDPYWIRCTLLGKHDEHEDSHTGLKWRSGLPVEGESKA